MTSVYLSAHGELWMVVQVGPGYWNRILAWRFTSKEAAQSYAEEHGYTIVDKPQV